MGTIVTHQNWRGQFAMGTYTSGAPSDCQQYPPSGCVPVSWPGWSTTAWHEKVGTAPATGYEHYWMGSLAVGMRDASGQMYMRNRYYDPATGQFTQTDPIGLAGGLNAYGFAAGDPVSYSDPYGLCPWYNLRCRIINSAIDSRGIRINPAERNYAHRQPLRARQASAIAMQIYGQVEQLAAEGEIPGGVLGLEDGPGDAIRHAAWSCALTQEFGVGEAYEITTNHEAYDDTSDEGEERREMDLYNNTVGRQLASRASHGECVGAAQKAYSAGTLRTR